MKKWIVLGVVAVSVSGCAAHKLETLSSKNQSKFYTTNNNSADFVELLKVIRNDESLITKSARKANSVKGALNLATLGTGIFGGYTTAFTNSVDIKEAGFAAATLIAIGGYANTDQRRDASRQAARRLDCIVREAQPFKGDFLGAAGLFINSKTPLKAAISGGGSVVFTPYQMPSVYSFFAPTSAAGKTFAATMTAEINEFESQMFSNLITEKGIYDDRFEIVLSTYRNIINNWETAIETQSQSYESVIMQYKQAVEMKKEQEDKKQDVKLQGQRLTSAYDNYYLLEQVFIENSDKYSSTAEAVKACAALD